MKLIHPWILLWFYVQLLRVGNTRLFLELEGVQLQITDEPCTSPCIEIITLIPIDTSGGQYTVLYRILQELDVCLQGLPSSNARVSCPRPSQNDIVLSIKEIR